MKNLTLTALLICLPSSVYAQCEDGICRLKPLDRESDQRLQTDRLEERWQDPFRPVPRETRFDWDSNGARKLRTPQVQAPRPRIPRVVVQPKISWEKNYRAAVNESARTGLPMMIKVSADWCGHCQRMKRQTMADPTIIRTMNANYIALELDADQNRQLIEQLKVTTLPTVLVVSPDLRILERKTGFQDSEQLAKTLSRYTKRVERPTETRLCLR